MLNPEVHLWKTGLYSSITFTTTQYSYRDSIQEGGDKFRSSPQTVCFAVAINAEHMSESLLQK